ncbi:metallophosphoesterase family protein [Aquibium microcysteis]|uniref:metallophosphoesterase family protein n=1 Tax=Aquibium microcysteis TaxID=675281 RepID=UPI00165D22D7|nr:metallophosphoesterase [Aquibium microcysteis]
MFRLAHLSDLHLGPLPDISYRELASKRITGYVNWQRNRRKAIHNGVTDALLQDIARHGVDHLAVTGDLVNLALDAEIDVAREWLAMAGEPDRLSVVPGNHDAYVPGALHKACRAWRPWMTGEKTPVRLSESGFPYLRTCGDVALIGVSSAHATAPFLALGTFREEQAAGVATLLDIAAARGLFRIVMIHHPPVRGLTTAHKRLYGIGLFQKIVARHGAELVLHGHTHDPTLSWIRGKGHRVPVLGVTAAGQGTAGEKQPAQYNLVEIDGKPGAWRVMHSRRGIRGQFPVLKVEGGTPTDLFASPQFDAK